jgi:hypothetical protein
MSRDELNLAILKGADDHTFASHQAGYMDMYEYEEAVRGHQGDGPVVYSDGLAGTPTAKRSKQNEKPEEIAEQPQQPPQLPQQAEPPTPFGDVVEPVPQGNSTGSKGPAVAPPAGEPSPPAEESADDGDLNLDLDDGETSEMSAGTETAEDPDNPKPPIASRLRSGKKRGNGKEDIPINYPYEVPTTLDMTVMI